MRRKDREITDIEEIRDIIEKCKVCRLAMQDEEGLYLVPLNFGYEFEKESLALYFHSAKEGRKLRAIQKNSKVCFEMDCEHTLIEANTPCAYGYEYACVMGNGKATILEHTEEKRLALSKLMWHQTGKAFEISEQMSDSVVVIKVIAESYTGKMCRS